MKLKNFDLTLLKAEIRKVWSRPTLGLAVGLVVLIAFSRIQTLVEIMMLTNFQSKFNSLIIESVYSIVDSQMLPLVLLSGILVSLSFARDYEQGLMQTLFSLPVSRASIFAVKFVAVVVPLTLLSWGITLFILLLNFGSTVANNLLVIQLASWALPVTFLAVMFYAGLAAMIALALKKTIPSVLTTVIIGFIVSFISSLRSEMIGALADYLVFTPYKAPIVTLGRLLGIKYPETGLENALPAWGFLALIVVYALMFLVPTYLYFTKRFEVKE
jgi:ABC-type transport system involved in multi-copper enzyme maturation permease subunit